MQQDSQNPVYYVQYAHARICSILKNLAADGIQPRVRRPEPPPDGPPEELRSWIRHLSSYTGEVQAAAKGMDPSKITRYDEPVHPCSISSTTPAA